MYVQHASKLPSVLSVQVAGDLEGGGPLTLSLHSVVPQATAVVCTSAVIFCPRARM